MPNDALTKIEIDEIAKNLMPSQTKEGAPSIYPIQCCCIRCQNERREIVNRLMGITNA